jgi:dUTP pyrophosphatase
MYKLDVKLLVPGAKAPTVVHAGSDLGYDLYALDSVTLRPGAVQKVRTGVAVEAYFAPAPSPYEELFGYRPMGLLVRDRSSMASKGVFTHGGVIDAGYRGEMLVLMTTLERYDILAGDKIAQVIPVASMTGEVTVVDELREAARGTDGFGSSGH